MQDADIRAIVIAADGLYKRDVFRMSLAPILDDVLANRLTNLDAP